MIDGEINNLLNESYKRAMNILVNHKKELHLLAGRSVGASVVTNVELLLCRGSAEIRDSGCRGREDNYRAEETSSSEGAPELGTAGSEASSAPDWPAGNIRHSPAGNTGG